MSKLNNLYDNRTRECESLLEKAYQIRVNDLTQSIDLTYNANTIALQLKNENLHARALSQLGLLLMVQGDFDKALTYSEEALKHFEKSNDIKGQADAKYNIASVHYKTDDFYLGLKYLLECLFSYRQLKDHYSESRVLKSMGTIYEYFGDQSKAIESYLKSVEAGQLANDPNLESNAYNPLSGIYLKKDQFGLAMTTIEKSIAIKTKTRDTRGLAFALYGRGKVYLKLKNYERGLSDLNASLAIQIEMGDKLGIAMVYNKLGLVYHSLQNYEEAKKYLLMALQTAEQFNIRFIRYKSLYNLHLVERAVGKYEESVHYLQRYIDIKEATINANTFNVIKSYEAISRIETLEREARVQKEKTDIIERKNAELDSFFYRVSHDLKGPIASLLGLHNLIQLEVKDQNSRHYFDMYQSQITRINNVVMDLINLTRMNHLEENKVKINFQSLIEECIHAYHYMDNFKSITFIKEVDERIEFHSEWAIVNTILQNLIENAIKYSRTDREPFVRICVRKSNDFLKIEVEDNGIGIPADFQSKVFNMFFRANDRIQGTGLGLYILKRAVERLNGTVNFVSDTIQGTIFTVLLPFSTSA
jgi:signal transduction histidine kinase